MKRTDIEARANLYGSMLSGGPLPPEPTLDPDQTAQQVEAILRARLKVLPKP